MLVELHIQNFAIIENLSLDFNQGMTVLTGETGAGKSIIIDALGLVAGGRGSAEFVRNGTKKCVLEAHFRIPENEKLFQALDEHKIDREDDIIIIQRDIHTSGRNVCRVNGSIVNIAALKEISAYLIDIHGQNEHQELMNVEYHQGMLDYYAGESINELVYNYRSLYKQYKKYKKQYDEWQNNEQENNQRLDLLSFQVDELNKANLYEHEDTELEEEANKLANFQKIMEALKAAYDALQGEESSSIETAGIAMNQLESISKIDDHFQKLHDNLSNAFYQLEESSSEIYDQLDSLEYDEARLNEIELRLDYIQQLKRKYGTDISEIMDYHAQAEKELHQLENREIEIGSLEEKVEELGKELMEVSIELSNTRRQVAPKLEQAIHEQLKALYMDKVEFKVMFKNDIEDFKMKHLTSKGMDSIEFFVSTNPGEPLKPLAKVASGGELSRMMLALKTIFSRSQGITSIIFDEVDTGVSGRVAQAIADKIYMVAVNSQVLCISHLPQVAAMADSHLYISKFVEDNQTTTKAQLLTQKEKIEEVARMMAGLEITEKTMDAAKELKEFSEARKIEINKS